MDLRELSATCARTLTERCKQPPSNSFSRACKAGNLMRLQSGLICDPSRGQSFLAAWTSSLVATPASPSVQQASDSELKMSGTSGQPSQMEFGFCDPESVFSRTSRDTSRWDSPQSLVTWKNWVTRCRLDYSARKKLARPTAANECSSWPTAMARDWKDTTSMALDSTNPDGTHRNRRDRLIGAIVSEMREGVATNQIWQTPTCNMDMVRSEEGIARRKAFRESIGRKSIPDGNLGEQMRRVCGQADQVNRSTHGSRQESWRTPSSSDGEGGVMEMREGCAGRYKLRDHVIAVQNQSEVAQKQWLTPRANEPTADSNFVARNADRSENCHGSLTSQVKSWPAPIVGDSHLASTPEAAAARIAEGKLTLSRHVVSVQNPQWATPRTKSLSPKKGERVRMLMTFSNHRGSLLEGERVQIKELLGNEIKILDPFGMEWVIPKNYLFI